MSAQEHVEEKKVADVGKAKQTIVVLNEGMSSSGADAAKTAHELVKEINKHMIAIFSTYVNDGKGILCIFLSLSRSRIDCCLRIA